MTDRIRVATLNLASGRDRSGRVADAEALARAVAALDADVVSVQEVDVGQPRSDGVDQPAALARGLAADHRRFAPTLAGTPGPTADWRPVEPVLHGPGAAPDGPLYGIALLSRRPVRRWHVLGMSAGRAKLPIPTGRAEPRFSWVPDEPRVAVAAELAGLTVVATHLSFAPHSASRQLLRLLAWTRGLPGPVLVAGDLNLVGPLPALVTGGTRLAHAPTYPAHGPRVQLDHLLALHELPATDARAERLAVGDHLAVSATVTVAGRPTGPGSGRGRA